MADRICPICDKEMSDGHDCVLFDVSEFSIELELLGLPFDIEPYGQIEEQVSKIEEPAVSPDLADSSDRPARSYNSFGIGGDSAPLFLRL